jgi:CRP-like cAMP-binding protein
MFMISPELLRRFPFFGGLSDAQLREISMITEEEIFEKGSIILADKKPADKLCLLIDGSVDLVYLSVDELGLNPGPAKELMAGEINPGEIFGISALIEPYIYGSTVRASMKSRVLIIKAPELRSLINADSILENHLLKQTIHALMDRLNATRVQLAAAQS